MGSKFPTTSISFMDHITNSQLNNFGLENTREGVMFEYVHGVLHFGTFHRKMSKEGKEQMI